VAPFPFRFEMKSPAAATDVACFQQVNASRMDANLLGSIEPTAKAFMPEDDVPQTAVALSDWPYAPQLGDST